MAKIRGKIKINHKDMYFSMYPVSDSIQKKIVVQTFFGSPVIGVTLTEKEFC